MGRDMCQKWGGGGGGEGAENFRIAKNSVQGSCRAAMEYRHAKGLE